MAVGYQSFYQAQLTANISDTDTVIPVDVAPTPSEGFLVIESTVTAKREIIYYTSKTTNSVTVPSGAGNGRGYDGTTATSHLQGAAVIMAPVGAMFDELRTQFTTTPQGWTSIVPAVSSVTHNGNRSYDVVFASTVASTLSPGMRLKLERTVAAPTTAFSLDGSNDYYNKTSPAGMTFTDDFTVSAWVYLTENSTLETIASRHNGTSGWIFSIENNGVVQLRGYSGALANYKGVQSYQSIPINQWVHVAAQIDMNTATTTPTTNYVMINGASVPCSVVQGGTNPTSLIQAGNLEIGSYNGGSSPFPGYIDQVAIYSAKVTQATHLAAMNQGLTGSETNLISAYSNGSTTDLAATGNNLTAQNGATTASVSWHGDRGTSATLDYALVMNVNGSTVTVQVPEGCTLPTTGGITSVSYSTQANPYGWVSDKGRWGVGSTYRVQVAAGANTTYGSFNGGGTKVSIPIGSYSLSVDLPMYSVSTNNCEFVLSETDVTGGAFGSAEASKTYRVNASAAANYFTSAHRELDISLASATTYTLYQGASASVSGNAGLDCDNQLCQFKAIPSNL